MKEINPRHQLGRLDEQDIEFLRQLESGSLPPSSDKQPERIRQMTYAFSFGSSGQRAKALIESGSPCEARKSGKPCGKPAAASIQVDAGREVFILSCWEDLPGICLKVYNELKDSGRDPSISINGHGRS